MFIQALRSEEDFQRLVGDKQLEIVTEQFGLTITHKIKYNSKGLFRHSINESVSFVPFEGLQKIIINGIVTCCIVEERMHVLIYTNYWENGKRVQTRTEEWTWGDLFEFLEEYAEDLDREKAKKWIEEHPSFNVYPEDETSLQIAIEDGTLPQEDLPVFSEAFD